MKTNSSSNSKPHNFRTLSNLSAKSNASSMSYSPKRTSSLVSWWYSSYSQWFLWPGTSWKGCTPISMKARFCTITKGLVSWVESEIIWRLSITTPMSLCLNPMMKIIGDCSKAKLISSMSILTPAMISLEILLPYLRKLMKLLRKPRRWYSRQIWIFPIISDITSVTVDTCCRKTSLKEMLSKSLT